MLQWILGHVKTVDKFSLIMLSLQIYPVDIPVVVALLGLCAWCYQRLCFRPCPACFALWGRERFRLMQHMRAHKTDRQKDMKRETVDWCRFVKVSTTENREDIKCMIYYLLTWNSSLIPTMLLYRRWYSPFNLIILLKCLLLISMNIHFHIIIT